MLQEHCSQLCYQKSRNVDETEAGDRDRETETERQRESMNMWIRQRQELSFLEEKKVERCYKQKHFGEVVSATLHKFQMHHKKDFVIGKLLSSH